MKAWKEYIDDALFLKWVFEPDDHIREYWEYYMVKYPGEREKLLSFKEELDLFRISNQKLTDERKKYLLEKIAGKAASRNRTTRIIATGRSLLKYAAFAFLFIFIGIAVSSLLREREGSGEFSRLTDVPQIANRPAILLADGSVINIGTRESEINYTVANKIIINNERVVELPVNKEGGNSGSILQSIPYGCRSKIVLSDKSVVWLNAGSRLIYPMVFIGGTREVSLQGEAYFEVEKDMKRPFVVHTADYSINVLGTKFNITAYDSDDMSQTVLTEGSIELKFNKQGWLGKAIVLKPNEMFLYNKKNSESDIQQVDPDQYVCWIDGILKCNNENLSRVIRTLERFYDIQIELKNPQDGSIIIDGKLDLKENKREVMYYLTRVAKRQFIEKNDWYYVIE